MALAEAFGAATLDGAALALLGWTTWTAFRNREPPSARAFVALLAALSAWALVALGAELAATIPGDGVAETLRLVSVLPAVAVPGA